MRKTVNIEVVSNDLETFGVLSEHNSDLPKPVNNPLQEWVKENFDLEGNVVIEQAGELVYEPNGEIIEFRQK